MTTRAELDYLAAHRTAALRRIQDLLTRKETDSGQRRRNVGAAQSVAEQALDEDQVLGYGRMVGFSRLNIGGES